MYRKDEIEPIAEIDTEHDSDHDAKSQGYGSAKSSSNRSISDSLKRAGSRSNGEDFSAEDLWLDAMTRVAIAVRHNAESGTKPPDDGINSAASVPIGTVANKLATMTRIELAATT